MFQKMRTPPLISLGVLCDYLFTIALDQKTIVQNNGQQMLKGTKKKSQEYGKFYW